MLSIPNWRDLIETYQLEDFSKPEKVEAYKREFNLSNAFVEYPNFHSEVQVRAKNSFAADWNDLCRIHYAVLSHRPLNVLEFGSGFSSAVIAHALDILDETFHEVVAAEFGIQATFILHSVDESESWLDVTRGRVAQHLRRRISFSQSDVSITQSNWTIYSTYKHVPDVLPDLIYLDGPSPLGVSGDINGLTFNHSYRMPISGDVLLLEYFLTPGTVVLIDGRTTNSRFLQRHLARDWTMYEMERDDVSLLLLNEKPLGKLNARQLEFSDHGPKSLMSQIRKSTS
jgi:hypothetical protein